MIKNIKKYLQESEKERIKYLRSLSLKKSIKIMEDLISSKLLARFTFKRKGGPISLEKALKHA